MKNIDIIEKILARHRIRKDEHKDEQINLADNGSIINNGTYTTHNHYHSADSSKSNKSQKNKTSKTVALVFVPLIVMTVLTFLCVIYEPSTCKSLLNFWLEIFNETLNFASTVSFQ